LRRWLVTGGCGFVGRNLIAQLARIGSCDVVAFDNQQVGTAAALRTATAENSAGGSSVRVVTGDILDREAIRSACRDRDVLVHLAAATGVVPSIEDPLADCMANVIGTLHCLEAARDGAVSRVVFASSGAPLGVVEPPMHEEKAARPCSPYGASKLAGEAYCSAFWHSYGLETVALRFGNVYGPHSSHKTSVVAQFIQQALAGEPLVINGDGAQTRDFIFTGDLVEAIGQAATVPELGGHLFQIATARETTVLELATVLVEVLSDYGISGVTLRHGPGRTGDVRRNYSDTSKARRLLEWEARTALRDGLAQTVVWFLEQKAGTMPDRLPSALPQVRAGAAAIVH
jgi:UDP-glucose 4-epimerase